MEVTSIQNGIIIDHVPAGTSLKVLEYLKIDPAKTKLALIMNADSKRYGSKDIIKIEDDKDIDLDVLGFVARKPPWTWCAAARSSKRSSRTCPSTSSA